MIMALCILCGCAASESRSEYGIFIGVDPDDLPEDMKDYDIIVIDAQNFTRGQIQKFKNNGQKVYSYINAGSIEKTRSYYGKYADLTLDPYENWDEEYWVDVSSEKWQDFISYDISQKLLDKDIDGFFVDNIDIYYQYPRPEIYNGLCNILNNLMDYDKPVIVNGGDVFVSEYISRNGNIKDILTGINQETVFSKINFDQETFEKNDEDTIEYFKKLKENNYQVVLINDGSKSEYHSLFEKMVHDCKIISHPFLKEKGMLLKKEFIISKNIYRIKKELLF